MKTLAHQTNKNGTPNSSVLRKGSDPFFGVQAKLNIGKPNDKYEQEADAVADKVVAKSESPDSFFGGETFFPAPITPAVQKSPFEEVQSKEETEEIQEKPLAETITPVIQLAANEDEEEIQEKNEASEMTIQKLPFEDLQQKTESTAANGESSPNLESTLNGSRGGGSPLPSGTKNQMESGFGTDFSNVRTHNDANSVQMNKELGSQAFASGNDIYFNEGKYNPSSKDGQHLLAHELTHTVQQGASPSNNVQKTEETTDTPTRPTSTLDITQRLNLTDEWATYLDYSYSEGERTFDVDVKIGESYRGVIKVNKQRSTAEGETAKYDLAEGNDRYLEISGWSFLNPLRQVGVTPILVLREFGDGQQTTGFLSVKTGDIALVTDVQGFIRGLNENLVAMSFLGIEPLNVDGLENTFESGRLVFQVSGLSTVVDGYLEAGGDLGITGETFTFNLNANVEVAGLANGEFTIARGEDGTLSGTGDIQGDIANVQASIHVEYIEGLVTIQGTGRMNSDKFSGEITLLVTDEARSTQMMHAALGIETMDAASEDDANPNTGAPKTRDNQVLAAWGEVQASITPWLEGTAKIGVDHEGHVTIVGEIVVPDEIELMEQRGKKVDLFDVEIRGGYGIPLVGQVFLFASVGMFVNAGFGPLVLKDVGFTGTYSTDPDVLQQFSITGTLGINAFAVIGLEAEAGVGVTLIGHDIKAGVNVTAAAGLRAYAEATPTFEYTESQAPEGGKVGESHLRGHFEAAAQLFLQLTGALFYELDSPWWSPAPDGREEYPLGEVQYPIGDSLGIGADIDWLVGSPDVPELTFSPVEFDPDKFTADVMADPPPRPMGDADAAPEGEWTGEPGSDQNANPEVTGDGEGLPPNSRREEDLSNLPDEQKYMRALDELSRLEEANPKPTLSVVDAEIRKVKRKYGITKIESRDEQDDQVSVYVEHARENNGRHLLNIPLMSQAERLLLLNAAMEALQTTSQSAADEEGKITRADAEQVLTTLRRNHPVIAAARVVDGQNTWDYFIDIGDKEETEGGNLKKESEIEEATDGDNLEDLSQIAIPFTETDGDNHTLRFAEENNDTFKLMVHSSPKNIFEYLRTLPNQADPKVIEATRLATEIRTMANQARVNNGIVPPLNPTLNTNMNQLSIIMSQISSSTLPTPEYKYSGDNGKAKSAQVSFLSANRPGGTPPGNSYVKGWEAIQDGLTRGGGHWKRLHLINQGFGGFGVPENLVPGTSSNNSHYDRLFDNPIKRLIGSAPNDNTKQGVVKIEVDVNYHSGEFPENVKVPSINEERVKKDDYARGITFEALKYNPENGNWIEGEQIVSASMPIDLPDWDSVNPATIGVATKSEYETVYGNLSPRVKNRVDTLLDTLVFNRILSPTLLGFIRGKSFSGTGDFRGQMNTEIDTPSTPSGRRNPETISKLKYFRDVIPVMVNAGVLKL